MATVGARGNPPLFGHQRAIDFAGAFSAWHQCTDDEAYMSPARLLVWTKTSHCIHRGGLQTSVTPCHLQQRQRRRHPSPRSSARCSAVCQRFCQTALLTDTVSTGKPKANLHLLAAAACILSVELCDAAELRSRSQQLSPFLRTHLGLPRRQAPGSNSFQLSRMQHVMSGVCVWRSAGRPGEVPGGHARADLGLPGRARVPGGRAPPGAGRRRPRLPHGRQPARHGGAQIPARRAHVAQRREVPVSALAPADVCHWCESHSVVWQ